VALELQEFQRKTETLYQTKNYKLQVCFKIKQKYWLNFLILFTKKSTVIEIIIELKKARDYF